MDEFGPVQILVVGFEGTAFNGEIMPELQRLKELDIIRLVDMAVVSKGTDGEIVGVEVSDLSDDQRAEFGAIAGALIGLGVEPDEEGVEAGALAGAEAADDAMWSIADTIPMGTTAAVALIEHRWAIPLRDAIRRNGGVPLADSWIHPEDLVAIGAAAAANED
jgi:uncharacterized membrane protein